MRAIQQHNTALVFTGALIVVITILILLAFPLVQSILETISDSVGDFLGAFIVELGKSYGR